MPLLLAALILSGCGLFGTPPAGDGEPTVTPAAIEAATEAVTAAPTAATAAPDATARPVQITLRLWVPPQFSPEEVSLGGQLLRARIDEFVRTHPGISVDVRVKRSGGQGGMLDALATASLAAPGVVPDLILLEQNNFAQAVREQRLAPLDDLLTAGRLAQSYAFALEQAREGEALYGLPLLGEAAVLVHALDVYPAAPATWDDILTNSGPLVFPAASTQVTLQQYLAAGGRLQDSSGNLLPDEAELARVLTFYQSSNELGILYIGTLNYATASETWRAYRENRAVLAITDTVSYLRERELVVNTGAARLAIPSDSEGGPALVRAWYLGLTTRSAASAIRQPAALELKDWLIAPDYLGEWSLALGYLPLQRDAVATWDGVPELAFAVALLDAGQPLPDAGTLSVLGPVLQKAVSDVLRGRATPQDAAATAVATLRSRE